jgi:ATP-dependent Clp protease ATP-binding subunit ClpA
MHPGIPANIASQLAEEGVAVIDSAEEEARALGHIYIGTEHILLGLLRQEDGLGARVLESLDITFERVRTAVLQIAGKGEEITTGHIQIPLTPKAKKVLKFAVLEARSLGRQSILTEFILLALGRVTEGTGARILLGFDADIWKLREEVIRMLYRAEGLEDPDAAIRAADEDTEFALKLAPNSTIVVEVPTGYRLAYEIDRSGNLRVTAEPRAS